MTLTTEELRDGDMPFPREVWVGRPNDMDHGDVPCVLSKFATLPRWEGDTARDRDFQRYVDGDICDSAEKYYKGQIAALRAEVERLRELIALEDANAEAGGWGAAVGARLERIKRLRAAIVEGGA